MSTAAKRAQKRRAKKDEDGTVEALSVVETIAATMAPSATEATMQALAQAAAPTQAATSASFGSGAAAAPASDPRVLLKERGNRAFGEKLMGEAVRHFTNAIEAPATVDTDTIAAAAARANGSPLQPPFLASVYSNRSAAYAACYEWAAALADADSAIALAPKWSKGHYRRGQALEGLMKFDLARAAYAAGLAADPLDAALARQLEAVQSALEEMAIVTPEQAPVNPEEDKFTTMINWLIAGKARFPSLYMKYYTEEYRGVHSLARIAKDETVLEVPLSHIMTSEVARASAIGQQIIASGVDLSSTHSFLACYLLQERHNPNSFWLPYLNILPEHYSSMPIFFNDAELSYLKGSFTLGKINDRHNEIRDEYENIVRCVPSFSMYALEEFVWARTVVITRIFGLLISGVKTDGLVPYADMLNHRRPRETSWAYDDSRGAFTITSLQAMQRGVQVYDSYGRKCNSRFFVNYGFALENNEADNQAVLWFTLPASDPLCAMKVRMLSSSAKTAIVPNQPRRFQVPTDYSEDVTKEVFSFLRFVHAKDSELLMLQASADKFDVRKVDPLSLRNEIEVVNDLAIAAQTSLSQFETTIEQDTALLADPTLTFNVRNAVIMRRGEKQVLEYYADLVHEVLPLIDMPWTQFKKFAAKCAGGRFDHYITTVLIPLKKSGH